MGAGLAKQISNKYKNVFNLYREECTYRSGLPSLLGECQIIQVDSSKYIANLFGQDGYGRDKQYTDYEALELAMSKLKRFASYHDLTVALPHGIGAGLAGGDWETIYKIIESVFGEYGATLYKL